MKLRNTQISEDCHNIKLNIYALDGNQCFELLLLDLRSFGRRNITCLNFFRIISLYSIMFSLMPVVLKHLNLRY